MLKIRKLGILLLASFVALIAGESCGGTGLSLQEGNMGFSISSKAFKQGEMIPSVYTCEGKNISPPISFGNPPQGTQALAMILHDPDAPRAGGFTHWVIYNIPPSTRELAEGIPPATANLDGGTTQGKNGANQQGYTGPCPPSGTHRYFFYLYALNEKVSLPAGASEQELRNAMNGHIISETKLEGLYQKQK
jgi:Raf kinase inhibitor-like YbhB/YbcL family protein